MKATAEESKSPIELFLQYFPSVEVQQEVHVTKAKVNINNRLVVWFGHSHMTP